MGLVQQRDFGSQVGDAVHGDQGTLPGQVDARVALEHPFVRAVIQEQIELPRLLGIAPGPQLLSSPCESGTGQQGAQSSAVGFPQVPARQDLAELAEVIGSDDNVGVLMGTTWGA
jgi:hypothetical protein